MLKNLLQGRFMNHPLHPLLVHLPIGLWIASLIFDIIHKVNGNANLAITSFYCLLFGLIGAVVAAPAGLADYLDIPSDTMPKRIATTHFMMNGGIIVLVVINLFLRYRMQDGVRHLSRSRSSRSPFSRSSRSEYPVMSRPDVEEPIYYWVPSIAPSGMMFYTGDMFPEWKGNLFIGAMAGQHLVRLVLNGERVAAEEQLLADQKQRVREVRQAPDGSIYILQGAWIVRLTPKK